MRIDTIEVPPLLMDEVAAPSMPDRGSHALAAPLEEMRRELAAIVRRAIHRGILPLMSVISHRRCDVERTFEAGFAAFREERAHIWPLLLAGVEKNPLLLLVMLREVSELLRVERVRWRVRCTVTSRANREAWTKFLAALDTYGLTLGLARSSMTAALNALASRQLPPASDELEEHGRTVLAELDVATSRFEFGVIVARELRDHGQGLRGVRFQVASDCAWTGADAQHVSFRWLLRRVVPAIARAAPPDEEIPVEADATPVEAALLADWIDAIVAA